MFTVSRTVSRWLARWLLCSCVPAAAAVAEVPSPEAQALQSQQAQLQQPLARSPFGRPVVLRSSTDDRAPQGDVYAVLDHGFASVADALRQPEAWCALMLLQTNVKRCEAQGQGPSMQLTVGIARRYTDAPSEAQPVTLRFRAEPPQADYMAAEMHAPQGPLGSRDYRLHFEATPAGANKTFIHLRYSYRSGTAARLATQAYLATSGRDKVGFTVVGQDEQGRPRHVGGIQGVAERNTMRYFLAIDAYLDSLALPPTQRVERRLRDFHAALERYPAQLRETTLNDYLAMKRRELRASDTVAGR